MKAGNHAVRTAVAVALILGALAPAVTAAGQQVGSWKHVAELPAGAIVTVTTRDGARGHYLTAFIDSQTLVVLRFIRAQSPERVARALRALPPACLATLAAADISFDGIRFSHGAVFDAGVKVGDIIAFAKDDVVEVEAAGHAKHGSAAGAIIGVGIGLVTFRLVAPVIGFHPCGGSCGDEKALLVAMGVGLPVGGGLLGYYAGRVDGTATIYRAAAVQPVVLDEAVWQRARRALPPSLRGQPHTSGDQGK